MSTKTAKRIKETAAKALESHLHGRATREAFKAFGQANALTTIERAVEGTITWKQVYEANRALARRGMLRESVAESAFGALLRLGVENIIQKGWELPATTFDKVLMSVASAGAYGVYGSTYRPTGPSEVMPGTEFPRVKMLPDEKILRNKKFGALLPIERELFEDDQTGEINLKASEMGEQMAQLKEKYFAGFLQGKSVTIGSEVIPAPVYTDPDGTNSVYSIARGNRPTTFTALTLEAFKNARKALMTIKDPLGNIVGGLPDTLVVAPNLELVANLLMNSSWTPTNVGASGTASFPTDNNPIKGMARVVVNVYLPDNAWFLGRSKKRSLILQTRTPLEVTQEDPNSGESFKYDIFQYRIRERWAMGWVLGGSRHWYEGNDGTISQPSLTPEA